MVKNRELPSGIAVQKFLGGVDYPADKQALLEKARQEGADEEILKVLERLPDQRYDSPVTVSREASKAQ